MPSDRDALRVRLRAYVAHESESSRRALLDSWAQTLADRVEAGVAVARLRPYSANGNGVVTFDCEGFTAKFREGDPLYLGDGADVEAGAAVTFIGYDVATKRLRLAPDRFESRGPIKVVKDGEYCLDRRGLGLDRLLLEGLDSAFHPENAHCIDALLGSARRDTDTERHALGVGRAKSCGLTETQSEALGRMVGTEGVTLIQGPPGTGKTRLLAEAAFLLAKKSCRIFVAGFTHRAVNNVLQAVRKLSPDVPVYKIGGAEQNRGLHDAGIVTSRTLDRLRLPAGGLVVGGTPFAVRKFSSKRQFHFVFIDEAGQMPVVHGAIAMTPARRVVVVGDPRQLPPVRQGTGRDEVLSASLYEFLESHGEGLMLDRSFRLNDGLTRFVSDEFYGGRLRPADVAAGRRLALTAGGPLREVLDPEQPLVWARVDHEGRTRRSAEEVDLVVDLVDALVTHHRTDRREIAIIAPFRAQVRALRYKLEEHGLFDRGRGSDNELVCDTVERMQGQEREVVVLSLVASDRDYLEAQADFFFEPGRLNVALTRARTKCIVVASRHAFRARPLDLDQLLSVAHFKRFARVVPAINLTAVYGGESATNSPGPASASAASAGRGRSKSL